eukprot:IDg18640t1
MFVAPGTPPHSPDQIALICLRHAARGVPIEKEELAFLVQKTFGLSLALRFKNGNLGRDRINAICKRNSLSFRNPIRHERCDLRASMRRSSPPKWSPLATFLSTLT